MAKYNIQPKKEKNARYQTLLSEETKDRLRDEILRLIVTERRYKDPTYNSKKLAADLNTNSRYISAVCATRFHKNYSELVNDYRVNDAMSLLTDKRYAKMSVEDISMMAGFSTRQSFYANFFKRIGITPRQYRLNHQNQ
ncbi:MAG TPA: AraC family transcriptional regulator [Prevotella sp.]|nr:helix-turn-helix domain-containing protein [uncultured Prevotella sp.]HBF04727.1 AraC family transcriptional regulator [Candidatus Segatella violae]